MYSPEIIMCPKPVIPSWMEPVTKQISIGVSIFFQFWNNSYLLQIVAICCVEEVIGFAGKLISDPTHVKLAQNEYSSDKQFYFSLCHGKISFSFRWSSNCVLYFVHDFIHQRNSAGILSVSQIWWIMCGIRGFPIKSIVLLKFRDEGNSATKRQKT